MRLIIVVIIIGVCLHGLAVVVALFLNRRCVDMVADQVVLVGPPELRSHRYVNISKVEMC